MEFNAEQFLIKGNPLVQTVFIMGLSPKTLRNMFLDDILTGKPEIIAQLPVSSNLSNHILNAIFHPFELKLLKSPKFPVFYSNSLTDSSGKTEYFHCLRLFEKISPTILELTKERRNLPGFMDFVSNAVEGPEEKELEFFTEIVFCLKTSSKEIDLFRKILKNFYSSLHSFEGFWNNCIVSVEFLKGLVFLLNDLMAPAPGVRLFFEIGRQKIEVPRENNENIGNYESCIAILMDLLDIKNIIAIWECILLEKSVVLMSANSYNIYLVMQAFVSLVFPFKPSQFCIPIIDPNELPSLLSNKPLIVGLSPGKKTFEDFKMIDSDLNLLNIDSNFLSLSKDLVLCDCFRARLGQKLQYLKAHYYVDPERLNIYRMTSLEKAINETHFFKQVRRLADERSFKNKSRLFVELVRKVFFCVFLENLSDFPKFLIDQALSGLEFQKDLFMQKVKKCSNCQIEDFWNELFSGNCFKEFIESYEKKAENSLRFLMLCEKFQGSSKSLKEEENHLTLTSRISTKKLFKSIFHHFGEFQDSQKNQVCKKFTADTGILLLEDYRKSILELPEPNPGLKKHKIFQGSLDSAYFDKRELEVPNIFYGDFCILQMMKGLVMPIGDKFSQIGKMKSKRTSEFKHSKSQEDLDSD
jgi:hypothetical protein